MTEVSQLPGELQLPGSIDGEAADVESGAAAQTEVRSPEQEPSGAADSTAIAEGADSADLDEEGKPIVYARPPPRKLERGEWKIWNVFCEIDEDEGGTLDPMEVAKMAKKLGFTLKPDDLANAFEKMDRCEHTPPPIPVSFSFAAPLPQSLNGRERCRAAGTSRARSTSTTSRSGGGRRQQSGGARRGRRRRSSSNWSMRTAAGRSTRTKSGTSRASWCGCSRARSTSTRRSGSSPTGRSWTRCVHPSEHHSAAQPGRRGAAYCAVTAMRWQQQRIATQAVYVHRRALSVLVAYPPSSRFDSS